MNEPMRSKYVSRVAYIDDMKRGPTLPLDVSFHDHAAVFFLERQHPCFQSWLALLEKSARNDSTIVFSYTSAGMYIRAVEPGDNIRGIVEEVFHGLQPNSTGFAIPGYPDIFLIPNDHPQLLDWLVLIHKSKNGKMNVVFSYDAYHHRVTSLALAEE